MGTRAARVVGTDGGFNAGRFERTLSQVGLDVVHERPHGHEIVISHRRILLLRRLLAASVLVGAATVTTSSQVFRGGVDVITVDVTVLDKDGRPVEELKPGDFTVKIDGQTRRVVSAVLQKAGAASPQAVLAPERFFSTNSTPVIGRKVMFAIDQLHVAPGTLAPLLGAAHTFLDDLTPADQAALVAFPAPGPNVQFTTDKTRVRAALRMELGHPSTARPTDFHVSISEALRISDREMMTDPGVAGPETARVIEREGCPQGTQECIARIKNEATVTAQTARTEGRLSIEQLESLLDQLALVDGPKTLVLMSASMFAEDTNALRELLRRAARARTTIHVIAVEPRLATADTGDQGPPNMRLVDRQYEIDGLQQAAAGTGGGFYRPGGDSAGVFKRIATEISASYVLGVESRPDDAARQRVAVEVKRKGVTVRASTSLAAMSPRAPRPMSDTLSDVLSSPASIAGIPLRMAPFLSRDPASGKLRVTVAADIGQPGAPATEYGVGYVLAAADGRIVARGASVNTLTATAREPAHYGGTIAIDPGTYTLRFGVVDKEGRRGSVARELQAAAPSDTAVGMSDLFVGPLSDAASIRPAVEPHVDAGALALYVELYPPADGGREWRVVFEIGEGEESPALVTIPGDMGPGPREPWRIARGRIETVLAPGRYVARARVLRDGVTAATVARPFVLGRAGAPPETPQESSSYSPELPTRTAAYVSQFVQGLANVVAQEDFDLKKPVRSDFLLVRYPGSDQELLAYRDVYQVAGATLPGHEERLADLFIKPIDGIRDRVREIVSDGEDHVPPMLNPLYALSFLQGHYQSRFRMTVTDAAAPWPDGVKVVSFVEAVRPTLLRWGVFGDFDLPTRGKAWIEEATGRVFQTELEIGTTRDRPSIVTIFKLDERLQVMVPAEMRTRNPNGVAVYSNFRRFAVSTTTQQ